MLIYTVVGRKKRTLNSFFKQSMGTRGIGYEYERHGHKF